MVNVFRNVKDIKNQIIYYYQMIIKMKVYQYVLVKIKFNQYI